MSDTQETPVVQEEPEVVQEETADVHEEPASFQEEPEVVQEETAAVHVEPASVQEEPASVQEVPEVVQEEPAKKKSDHDLRSSSIQGSHRNGTMVSVHENSPDARTSPLRQKNSISRESLMCEHAAYCSAQRKLNNDIERHRTSVRLALKDLETCARNHVFTGSALEIIAEEDKKMFTSIPQDIRPRKQKKEPEDRALKAARAQMFRNSKYNAPKKEKSVRFTARCLVDPNRPLPLALQGLELRKENQKNCSAPGRYDGMSRGDLSNLLQDPKFKPVDPTTAPRFLIQKRRDEATQFYCKPHSPEALLRKKGESIKKTPEKKLTVPADFVPRVASELPVGHGDEARHRIEMIEAENAKLLYKTDRKK
eukprot:Tbor_TRINITY_DN2825_c0_g1::TRINITY_DN2825_c0_g1_i2::g.23211::m.23211